MRRVIGSVFTSEPRKSGRAGLSGSLWPLIILPPRFASNRNHLCIDWIYFSDDGLDLECVTSSADSKNHTGMFLRQGSRGDWCGP